MVIRGINSRIVGVLRDYEDKLVPIGFVATKLQLTEDTLTVNVSKLKERGIVETEGDNIMLISIPESAPEEPDEEEEE